MAALPMLKVLKLADNKLTTLSAQINQCKKLERINLDNNNIEIIPASIGELIDLKELSLNQTTLKTTPVSIAKLQKLKKISLANCTLIDIELLLNCLKENKLEELNLSNGNIESFPEEIPTLQIQQIKLKGNALKKTELKRLIQQLPYSTIVYE
jgi:Leucine-rich repeat (LRR) protein